MQVKAQVGMVMNLDKCIGCHTCSVTCKQVWTNRPGHRVHLVQQRRDQAGRSATRKRYEDQEQWQGGWTLDRSGQAAAEGGRAAEEARSRSSGTPTCRRSTTTTSRGPTTTRR